tara:strand:- start:486 stop:2201 length:1716 start_codon:yes stop_codon:yes gene_type:complete
MPTYKLTILDAHSNLWKLYNSTTYEEATFDNFNPIDHKLLNFDVFSKDPLTNEIKLVHSVVRNIPHISGILVLNDQKTYGKTSNSKFYYKCIPDDKRIAPFLIPYNIKNISFSKTFVNKYVAFKFTSWTNKHPIGELTNVIGDVNKLENFYEYQLYCKSLYASLQKFTKAVKTKLRENSELNFIETINAKYNIEDRRESHNVYTIDPKNSKDFDDGFSIKQIDNCYIVSIYISNVPIWMNTIDLWTSFSDRIATIYLPDRKRPMLPNMLSEFLCSLQENQVRFAFTLDIHVDVNGNIIDYAFKNTCISVKKNYRYSDDFTNFNDFTTLKKVLLKMNNSKFTSYVEYIRDSHDVIAYLMILMNYISAQEFLKYKTGIFRSMKINNNIDVPKYLPNDIGSFLKLWKSNSSKYVSFDSEKTHDMLKLNEYIHITSPIRRLVDTLNMLELQHCLGLMDFTKESYYFHQFWTSIEKLDYINQTMQSIRKVQNECNILTKCILEPEVLGYEYNGYIFDVMNRNDGLYQYIVFISELKMINKFISYHKLEKFSKHTFKLYLFEDKDNLKQKVRYEIQI